MACGFIIGDTSHDETRSMNHSATLYESHFNRVAESFDRALERAGASWAIIPAGQARVAFLDDRTYEFIANPHFKYWLPLTDLQHSAVIFERGKKPVLAYYQPADFWHKTPEDPEGYWLGHFDVKTISEISDIDKLLPENRETGIAIADTSEKTIFGLERINPVTALNVLHNARTVKSDYEISLMRDAQALAIRGHRAAAAAFDAGGAEYDIHMAYCQAMRQREYDLPYNNIVALNEHAAVLHYQVVDREAPAAHHSFLIDAGAQVCGYAADITRTYAGAGQPIFAALIERMETLQLAIVDEVKAGVDYRDLHLGTHQKIAEVLLEAELARGSADEIQDNGITRAFFPHGLGHFLGLQVHDVAGLTTGDEGKDSAQPDGHESLRLTRHLAGNQVLTIEPGLYFIPMLLEPLFAKTETARCLNRELIDALTPCGGIRIEDNVQVLTDGRNNLTREAFAQSL